MQKSMNVKTFKELLTFFDGILKQHVEHQSSEDIRDKPHAYYRFGENSFILIAQHDEQNIGKKLLHFSVPLVILVSTDLDRLTFWHQNVYTGKPEKIDRKSQEIRGSLIKHILALKEGNPLKIDILFDNSDVLDEFYNHYSKTIDYLMQKVRGIESSDKKRFVITLVNRFIFLWFLQQKGLLDANPKYFINRFKEYSGKNFNQDFVIDLFFQGLNKEEAIRPREVSMKLGKIKYMNGGLFRPRKYEAKYDGVNFEPNRDLIVPNEVFYNPELSYPFDDGIKEIPIFNLLESKDWTTAEDDPDIQKISPKVLGYIFEKNINALEGGQKEAGAYYTSDDITYYLCKKTIYPRLLKKAGLHYKTIEDAFKYGNTQELKALFESLRKLRIIDSAVGSGHFLIDSLSVLDKIYDILKEKGIHALSKKEIREYIVTENLYGVDIMAGAVEVCQLRMFLSIAETYNSIVDIEPLPNIDYNIMEGNSLIGYVKEDVLRELKAGGDVIKTVVKPEEKIASMDLFGKQMALSTYTGERISELHALAIKAIKDAEKAKETYKHSQNTEEACRCKIKIESALKPYRDLLNKRLFNEFHRLKDKKMKMELTDKEVYDFKPFHWVVDFAKVMNEGGFDIVVGNPPWNKWKPNSQEYFEQFDASFRRLDKQSAIKRMKELCSDNNITLGWEKHLKHIKLGSSYFKSSERYKRQSATVLGRTMAGDLNLYQLFMEADFSLMKDGGYLGLIVPSGFYTDAGCKGLRELYFEHSEVKSMYCFENRKKIFKEIDSRYKFITIVTEKSGKTEEFGSAFMLHDKELLNTLDETSLKYPLRLVEKFSPYSNSIMELKNQQDFVIAEKMYKFPALGEKIEVKWNIKLTNEFHMTGDSDLFNKEGRGEPLPLYEGKMIWHYEHTFSKNSIIVYSESGVERLTDKELAALGKEYDGHTKYRFAYRQNASQTNIRTFITTVLPKNVFYGHSLFAIDTYSSNISNKEQLFLTSICNSFSIDWIVRNKVSNNLSTFFIYELPIPRYSNKEPFFNEIIERAAKLICTTPEFDDFAKEVGLGSHENGVTDDAGRQRLKNEIDAYVAKIYGLTRAELVHILFNFPIVQREHPEIPDGVLKAFDQLGDAN